VILSAEGYRVIAAETPEEALEVNGNAGEIDLLLTDLLMPRMSGCSLADALLITRPHLEVLYMSGCPHSELSSRGVNAEPSSVIEKPFSASELLDRVRAALHRDARSASAG